MEKASERVFEPVWHLPIQDEHKETIKGAYGDISNTGKSRYGGASSAAAFLLNFVEKDTKWAHLDIAGPAMAKAPKPPICGDQTGFGAALMLNFIKNKEWRNKNKLFYETNTLQEVITQIENINSKYSTADYNIVSYLSTDAENINGVILQNNIMIPIKSEPILDQGPIIYQFRLNDYNQNIKKYFQLWKYSNYQLNIKPIRNIMNSDKMIKHILLQNNHRVK